jgi:hypothetical protein
LDVRIEISGSASVHFQTQLRPVQLERDLRLQ